MRKQTVFKIVQRLGIEPEKSRSSAHRGQSISYISLQDVNRILEQLPPGNGVPAAEEKEATDSGTHGCVFYLLLLEPTHDPGRFKVGIADIFPERLRQLRYSAPLLKVVKTWPCKRLWEKTAIDCVTDGCEKLHTQVFRAQSIDAVVEKCEQFFKMMPRYSG